MLLVALNLKKNEQKFVTFFCILIITFFASARGYIGTDTYSYHQMFSEHQEIPFLNSIGSVEPLFSLFMRASSLLSESSFFFIAIFSIFQGVILFKLTETSRRPALFLLIYIAVYYSEFEFNILRAGTAIMLLVLATRYIWHLEKMPFYACCIAAISMHYSAIVGFLILMYMREQAWRDRILLTIISVATSLVVFNFFMNESRLAKLLFYSNNIEKDNISNFGIGFFAIQFLYILYYVSIVKKNIFVIQTFLLALWLAMMWVSLSFGYIDRLKIIIGALYLFLGIELDLAGWRKNLHITAISGIVIVSLFGNLKAMEKISLSKDLDFNYASSPFIPYKFMWEE